MEIDLEEVSESLIQLAYDAGAMILAAAPSSAAAENKKNCMKRFPVDAVCIHG